MKLLETCARCGQSLFVRKNPTIVRCGMCDKELCSTCAQIGVCEEHFLELTEDQKRAIENLQKRRDGYAITVFILYLIPYLVTYLLFSWDSVLGFVTKAVQLIAVVLFIFCTVSCFYGYFWIGKRSDRLIHAVIHQKNQSTERGSR